MMSETIQVSGMKEFPKGQWRNALLYFLNGVLSGDARVTYRPKVSLIGCGFRLHPTCRIYTACVEDWVKQESPPLVDLDEIIETSCQQEEFERALMRFVKDDSITQIRAWFYGNHCECSLVLWKTRQRGFLGMAATGCWTEKDSERAVDRMCANL